MVKRFQTYFGVPIPPFKTDKLGAGSITIRFILTGKIPSKQHVTSEEIIDYMKQTFNTEILE